MESVTLDDGVRLTYRIDGPTGAPVLVLVNSVGTDMRMWRPQIAALRGRYRVVRHDARGHGRSDAPAGPYSIDRLGLDLLALLDHLHISSAALCGISLGGLIVQWLAARHPERVERAILANTAARIGTVEGWNARIDAVRGGGMAAVRETVLARFFSASFRATHAEEIRAIREMVEAIDPIGYIGACAALRDADLRASLPAIRAPTLIVAGALDESTPPLQSEELHAALAGSELLVLQGAGHLSNVEQPAAFNACLLAFLARGADAGQMAATIGGRVRASTRRVGWRV